MSAWSWQSALIVTMLFGLASYAIGCGLVAWIRADERRAERNRRKYSSAISPAVSRAWIRNFSVGKDVK